MYNDDELKQRFTIIKNSSIDDIIILDENYRKLLAVISNPEEQKQVLILRSSIKHRLDKLTISENKVL
jgi:hypothetical protein